MPNRERGSFQASDSGSTIQIGKHKDGRRTHTFTESLPIEMLCTMQIAGSCRNRARRHDGIFHTYPNHIASRKLPWKPTARRATAHAHDKRALLAVDLSPFVRKCSDSMAKSTVSQANLACCGSCHQIDSSGPWRLFQVRLQDATLKHHSNPWACWVYLVSLQPLKTTVYMHTISTTPKRFAINQRYEDLMTI
jgi:cytochrome c553